MCTTIALYVTRITVLSPAHVGIGLTSAGFAGMTCEMPLGILGGPFVAAGMALVPATAWAERTRVRYASLLDDPPVSAIPTLD